MKFHRRDAMIRLGQAGLGGLALPGLLRAEQARARESRSDTGQSRLLNGKAKACILVYLWGGPPQQDTFDMKPHAPAGIRSQFGAIDTAVPGIQICDQLPQIAKHTDKMAIVRSYTHPSNRHEVGVYHTLCGKIKNTLAVPRNQRNRLDFPHPGSVISYFSPPGGMPASVTVPRPIGHDGVVYTGTYAGFLGPRHDPMELKQSGEVAGPPPHSLELPAGLSDHRLLARKGLLKTLEDCDRRLQQTSRFPTGGLDHFREQAFRMLTAPSAKGAFKVDKEPDRVRDRYGRNEYGEAFLMSRRLIEAGVRLVTLTWYHIAKKDGNVLNVWDNHGGTGSLNRISGYDMLRSYYCLPSLDQGYSALLDDLSQRGMLDETLVVMLGEFGRTPKINKNQGRDHWGPCQSVVFAGGGIQGGQVYGESDKIAAYPRKNPVKPEDAIATLYHAFGLPPETPIPDASNRPHRISDGEPVLPLFG